MAKTWANLLPALKDLPWVFDEQFSEVSESYKDDLVAEVDALRSRVEW
jgi:hypothetical protein